VDSCDYSSVGGGINEQSSLSSMNIFPNPSSGKMTVSLDVKKSDHFELVVWDISGKKMIKEMPLGKISEGKKDVELDLSSLTNGFYLVELKTAEGSVFHKLLIEH
ncbi:MAG TPA: T9SS type A sorting domain-containing protein, partial [Bacteroidia bacterium]|nr:T9SS type A sorting domain-containing protein [Bacteroidia bacterium]